MYLCQIYTQIHTLTQHRTGDSARHPPHYTHVISRMVKRLREEKSLHNVDAHKNIVAKLGNALVTVLQRNGRFGGCGEGGLKNQHE